MNPGTLNNRIHIMKKLNIVENGFRKYDLEEFHSVWCRIQELYGKELYEAVNVKLENTLKFKIRYSTKLKDLNTKDYIIKWQDKEYNIIHVDYMNYNKKDIVIKAIEVI